MDEKRATAKRLRKMLERQGYRCYLSGRPMEPETASPDHMLPVSRGGTHAIDNICIVDRDINRAKGTQTISEFVAMCREVVGWMDGGRDEANANNAPPI